ncbi:MAG: chromate transporter [Chloroflexi bacterium]|nr:chromate transporter [Chloroflexota bacterium]
MNEYLQLILVFGRLSLLSFGGGIGILPEMERLVVEEHHWLTHRQFVDSFALGQLTPGPGMLMVMATGYRVAGVPGALVAAAAIFAPAGFLSWFVAERWTRLRRSTWIGSLREALGAVALGLLAAGVLTLGKSGVDDIYTFGLTGLASWLLMGQRLNPAFVVLLCGLMGWIIYG